ncbi:MAG: DNA alkylation repair protein [Candidatus Marinimicrobia bacterium]|jgi:3-methyladenine DNA glycosylase AlkD|nr:DNA alkylation repair protein [Candidatus Neomarinimicrobiota bacterium]
MTVNVESKNQKSELFSISLLAELREIADPEKAKMQEAYMKNKMSFLGVAAADVKQVSTKLCKSYSPENNNEYRHLIYYVFNNAQYREEWYAVLRYCIRFNKFITIENIDLYMDMILKSQWWDIVDGIATNLMGPALLDHANIESLLMDWVKHHNMWVRRTSLLTQLKYKNCTDFNLLARIISLTMDEKEFFIRKAIGWALRQYSYTNPDAVLGLIKSSTYRLSNLSKRESLKGLKRMGITI